MGWLIGYGQTRKETIERCTKTWEDGLTKTDLLGKAVRGNHLWTAWAQFHKATGQTDRFVVLFLLGTDGQGNWGYKDISEDMGPYKTGCPLSLIDLTESTGHARGEYATNWRAKVRFLRLSERGLRLSVGKTVKLKGCSIPEAVIVSVRPLRASYGGITYKLRRRLIDREATAAA